LTASKCTDIINTDCGWCPSLQKAYFGNRNGAYPLTCPSTQEAGSWVWDATRNCKCLTASECTDIIDTDCGWCPSRQKAYFGNGNGAIDPLTCPPNETSGQWTWDPQNCKMFSALTCTECKQGCPTCGWCSYNQKCYLGNSLGPYNYPIITCPNTYWAWDIPKDCPLDGGLSCHTINNGSCTVSTCGSHIGNYWCCPYPYDHRGSCCVKDQATTVGCCCPENTVYSSNGICSAVSWGCIACRKIVSMIETNFIDMLFCKKMSIRPLKEACELISFEKIIEYITNGVSGDVVCDPNFLGFCPYVCPHI